MEGRELRRSFTQMEFPVTSRGSRAHEHKHLQQHQARGNKRFVMSPAQRGKLLPTMEIYRPPGQRIDSESSAASRLNVHAKEFVMSGSNLQTSKSTGNILVEGKRSQMNNSHHTYQQSQNHHYNSKTNSTSPGGGGQNFLGYPLNHSKSTVLHSGGQHKNHSQMRVQWEMENVGDRNNNRVGGSKGSSELKRSKSMSAAHSHTSSHFQPPQQQSHQQQQDGDLKIQALSAGLLTTLDLGLPKDITPLIQASSRDPNEYKSRELMDLAQSLVEKATENRQYAERLALCCANICERARNSTFLESLLNNCRYTLEKKNCKDSTGSKYYAFMAFLSNLYSNLKRLSLDERTAGFMEAPCIVLLRLLVQCCQGSLREPVLKLRQEVECLFFVITTIGRELEQECPKQLESLMADVRDAFFNATASDAIRKTLMQLIELHAAKWQLPAFTVMYYQAASAELP